jgi:hypothetical protein
MKQLRFSTIAFKTFHLQLIFIIIVLCMGNLNAEIVKILLMGDTQKITDQKPNDFKSAMDKMLTNSVTKDADFILQMGDITEDDKTSCWEVARDGWYKLDGKMPYVLNVGNNDGNGDKFINYFPLGKYQVWPSFVANYDNHRNVAHNFKAGGVDWLVISLKRFPDVSQMNWAENLVKNNPDKKVIFVSHAANVDGGDWAALRSYKNLVFALCGHTGSTESLLTGSKGNKIGWIKTCWHDPNKDHYVRVLLLDTKAGTAKFRFYSPLDEKYDGSEITWSGFDFAPAVVDPGTPAKLVLTANPPGLASDGSKSLITTQVLGTSGLQIRDYSKPVTFSVDAAGTLHGPLVVTPLNGVATVEVSRNYGTATVTAVSGGLTASIKIGSIVNLVENFSFEIQGASATDAAGWTQTAGHTRSNDEAHSGLYSMKSSADLTNSKTTVPVEAGVTYTISGWILNKSSGNASIDMNDIPGELTLTSTSSTWTEVSGTWTNTSNLSEITLRLVTDNGNSEAYFDDISFHRPGGGATAIITGLGRPLGDLKLAVARGRLDLSSLADVKTVMIYHLNGKMQIETNITKDQKSLNISGLPQGTYMARIYTADGYFNQPLVNWRY